MSDDAEEIENLPTLQIDWEEVDEDAVEKAANEQRRQKFRTAIRRKYPFLNDNQVEVVGSLDDAIDECVPKVHLPRLKIKNMDKAVAKRDVWRLLKWPTLTFVLTGSFAAVVVSLENVTLGKLYPFLVTLLAFAASVPSIFEKYDGYFDKITTGINAAKKRIDPAVNELEHRAVSVVDTARQKLNQFVNVTKREIQKVQANVFLTPKVSKLEGILDGKERQLRTSIQDARKQADVDYFVPWALKKKRNYHCAVVLPIMVIMLGIQFVGTWRTGEFLDPTGDGGNKWEPIITSVQTYAIALGQILFAYILTRKKRVVGYVNRKIHRMDIQVNRFIRQKAGEVFEAILNKTMNMARRVILEIVTELRRIEQVAVKTKEGAHQMHQTALCATEQVEALELSTGTSLGSSWLKSASDLLYAMVVKIDDCTAGLINCTGFVEPEKGTTNKEDNDETQTKSPAS